jgi:hypothetical protein
MKKSHEGGQRNASERTTEPRVAIFWLVEGKPIIDSVALTDAEPYGDHLTHPRGHADVWEQYQRLGMVPLESEYEEFPRGRVMHNPKTRRFTFLADKCILKDTRIVSKIMSSMNLPGKNTDRGTDSHYRCFACLHSGSEDLL